MTVRYFVHSPNSVLITCASGDSKPTAVTGWLLLETDTGTVYKKTASGNIWDAVSGGAGDPLEWGNIGGTLADQTDLQALLDAKASGTHSHAISDVTNLQSGLDGKASSSHSHAISDITNLQSGLDGKAASSHSHAISDTTNLQSSLDAKAASSHNHAAGDINSGTVATARLGSGTADSTTFLRGDQTWASPSGGSDPWTYQVLSSDFTTPSSTAVDVTQGELLGFTPAANTKYIFEAQLMLRTATATVNPRVGFAWSTGLTDGVCQINQSQSATAQLMAFGNINAAMLVAVGGLPNTTQSWPSYIWGMVVAGATPSGNTRVQLASETNGTTVRAVAGSWLRYRSYT